MLIYVYNVVLLNLDFIKFKLKEVVKYCNFYFIKLLKITDANNTWLVSQTLII